MLEYTKSLLQKVSFDQKLFLKELKKSLSWLSGEELTQLKDWALSTFAGTYQKELTEAFKTVS